ncbi:MAG: GGDEF domain-containing protein [Burkholderiales bacterium]|nr:GGDEF domain-containing protein [Burkholderiales bacterium]
MLDLRTLALITMVCAAGFLAATVTLWRLIPQERSLRDWAGCAAFLALGNLLLALRGVAPDFLSIVIANTVTVAGLAFQLRGTRALLRLPPAGFWLWLPVILAFASCTYFTYAEHNLPARIVTMSLAYCPFLISCGRLFWRHGEPLIRRTERFTAILFFVGVALYLSRAYVASNTPVSADFTRSPAVILALPYLYTILFLIWMAVTLTLNVSARLHRSLAEARDRAEAANRELMVLSVTDKLTQVYNRVKLDAVLNAELDRAARHEHPLAVILLDVDHFKEVNDLFGHNAGDEVLASLGALLKQRLRKTDTVGRWGGEEFLIVLPETHAEAAVATAEALRLAIESTPFPVVKRRTASFGVACAQAGDSVVRLIARADDALYAAKHGGRNGVVLAPGSDSPRRPESCNLAPNRP